MSDELDRQLLRHFAQSQQPLEEAQFLAQVTAHLHGRSGRRVRAHPLRSIAAVILSGLATGIAAPLRLRHAGLMALGAAALTVWATLQGI
jgi:hypothetical protein